MVEQTLSSNEIPLLLKRYAQPELLTLENSRLYAGNDVPHGNGEAVVVIPGMNESDSEMVYLMRFLSIVGYRPTESGIGHNFGYPWQTHKVEQSVLQLKKEFGTVYVVGHSLGGFMGAQISQHTDSIAKVVALGAPFLNAIQPANSTMIESIFSPEDGVVPSITSQLHGTHTRNFQVENPNHFALLCHEETFREIAVTLAS